MHRDVGRPGHHFVPRILIGNLFDNREGKWGGWFCQVKQEPHLACHRFITHGIGFHGEISPQEIQYMTAGSIINKSQHGDKKLIVAQIVPGAGRSDGKPAEIDWMETDQTCSWTKRCRPRGSSQTGLCSQMANGYGFRLTESHCPNSNDGSLGITVRSQNHGGEQKQNQESQNCASHSNAPFDLGFL